MRTYADLYYNRYRDYDPTTGRYIQADPIGLDGGDNAYLYAMGNPVRWVDPLGTNTINVGWQCSINLGPISFGGFGGIAYDGRNAARYRGVGGGWGFGGGGSCTVQVGYSNAPIVCDLRGRFDSVSASAGDGMVIGGEGYHGSDANGDDIWGGNFNIGLGAGVSGSAGPTYTWIN
jgi:uncharacterized protein RhaS with RHS repeats